LERPELVQRYRDLRGKSRRVDCRSLATRLFSVVSLIVSLALLLALVPGGAVPTAAQAQPASVQTPAPAQARVAVALQSTPVMFVENVGQFDPFSVQTYYYNVTLQKQTVYTRSERIVRSATAPELARLSVGSGDPTRAVGEVTL